VYDLLVVGCGGAVLFSPEEMLPSRQLTEMGFVIIIRFGTLSISIPGSRIQLFLHIETAAGAPRRRVRRVCTHDIVTCK
jgi:hypothetical protein